MIAKYSIIPNHIPYLNIASGSCSPEPHKEGKNAVTFSYNTNFLGFTRKRKQNKNVFQCFSMRFAGYFLNCGCPHVHHVSHYILCTVWYSVSDIQLNDMWDMCMTIYLAATICKLTHMQMTGFLPAYLVGRDALLFGYVNVIIVLWHLGLKNPFSFRRNASVVRKLVGIYARRSALPPRVPSHLTHI